MKKLASVIFTVAFLVLGTIAQATTYENSAFIGSWVARGEEGSPNARLYVDFCDSERIKCRFRTFNGEEIEREFEIYQAPINDTQAQSTFSTVKSVNNWYPKGKCSLTLLGDMIECTLVADNGVRVYSGVFKPESTEFNKHQSPYNTNVKISINSEIKEMELSPFILKWRTFVPLRGVFEAMGINVEWFDTQASGVHTHEIRATRGDITVSIKRENKNGEGFGSWYLTKTKNDQESEIDIFEVQPVIIKDYTFVPLRVIVESFETKIDWDNDTRTVLIDDESVKEGAEQATPQEGENVVVPEENGTEQEKVNDKPIEITLPVETPMPEIMEEHSQDSEL